MLQFALALALGCSRHFEVVGQLTTPATPAVLPSPDQACVTLEYVHNLGESGSEFALGAGGVLAGPQWRSLQMPSWRMGEFDSSIAGLGTLHLHYDDAGDQTAALPVASEDENTLRTWGLTADGGSLIAGRWFEGQLVLDSGGPTETVVSTSVPSGLVVRTAPDGSLVWWRQLAPEGQVDRVHAALLHDEGVLVATTVRGDHGFGPPGVLPGRRAVLARLADDGDVLWVEEFGGTAVAQVTGVVHDPVTDRFTLVGTLDGEGEAVFGPGSPGEVRIDPAGPEAVIAQYSGTGQLRWVTVVRGLPVSLAVADVAPSSLLLEGGDIVVSGVHGQSATFAPGRASSVSVVGGQGRAGWVARFTSDGELVWVTRLHTSGVTPPGTVDLGHVVELGGRLAWVGSFTGIVRSSDAAYGSWDAGQTVRTFLVVLDPKTGRWQCGSRQIASVWDDVRTAGLTSPFVTALDEQRLALFGSFHGELALDLDGARVSITSEGWDPVEVTLRLLR